MTAGFNCQLDPVCTESQWESGKISLSSEHNWGKLSKVSPLIWEEPVSTCTVPFGKFRTLNFMRVEKSSWENACIPFSLLSTVMGRGSSFSDFLDSPAIMDCNLKLQAERNPVYSKLPFVKVFYHQNKNRNKVVPNLIGLSSLKSRFASGDLFCWVIHKYIFIWLMCSMSFKLNHFQEVDSKLNVTNIKTITIVNYLN